MSADVTTTSATVAHLLLHPRALGRPADRDRLRAGPEPAARGGGGRGRPQQGLLERLREAFPAVTGGAQRRGTRTLRARATRGSSWSGTEVVAFLDDDARAETGWLAAHVAAYDDARVIGVGGPTRPALGDRPAGLVPHDFDWVVGCTHTGVPDDGGPDPQPDRREHVVPHRGAARGRGLQRGPRTGGQPSTRLRGDRGQHPGRAAQPRQPGLVRPGCGRRAPGHGRSGRPGRTSGAGAGQRACPRQACAGSRRSRSRPSGPTSPGPCHGPLSPRSDGPSAATSGPATRGGDRRGLHPHLARLPRRALPSPSREKPQGVHADITNAPHEILAAHASAGTPRPLDFDLHSYAMISVEPGAPAERQPARDVPGPSWSTTSTALRTSWWGSPGRP